MAERAVISVLPRIINLVMIIAAFGVATVDLYIRYGKTVISIMAGTRSCLSGIEIFSSRSRAFHRA